LACLGAASAPAQLQLYWVQGDYEAPVSQQYGFGMCAVCNAVDVQFRLKNTGANPTPLTILSVDSPFSIVNAPQIPQTVAAGGAVNFTVRFAPPQPVSYSANLVADGVSLEVIGSGRPGSTISISDGGGGAASLSAGAAVDFGSVVRGATVARQIVITNPAQAAIQHVAVAGDPAFQIKAGPLPLSLPATIEVDFSPTSNGTLAGVLEIDNCAIPLTGVGLDPAFPQPAIELEIASAASSEQGTLKVSLPGASQSTGTGRVQIEFHPTSPNVNADNGIVFLSTGTQSATFTINPGDTAGHFGVDDSIAFQTGTTAGDLVFTLQLGEITATKTLTIAPAIVGVDSSQAQRTSAGLDLVINAFDNTRTSSTMTFTFFDQSGATLTPGAITVDGIAAFQQYFYSSDEGGVFALHAFFPVTGNPAQVDSVEVQIVNSVGTARTAKLRFTTP
jgi:hypothetical protein